MYTVINYIKNHILLCCISLAILAIISGGLFYYKYSISNEKLKQEEIALVEEISNEEDIEVDEEKEVSKIKVDIKGEVNNPGVYELEENSIVNDLISLAGGLKESATTENINLSYKLSNQMVIIIYSKDELKEENIEISEPCVVNVPTIDACVENQQSIIVPSEEIKEEVEEDIKKKTEETKKDEQTENNNEENVQEIIMLNQATKEQFMNLPGIGEAKAENIIKYRQENGEFLSIEDIKNVDGIGEAIFEQIKDFITLE